MQYKINEKCEENEARGKSRQKMNCLWNESKEQIKLTTQAGKSSPLINTQHCGNQGEEENIPSYENSSAHLGTTKRFLEAFPGLWL